MKTNENPVEVLRGIVAKARAQASAEREMLRTARLQAERAELVISPGTGPVEAARLSQERDKKKDASRRAERVFNVLTRTEEILDAEDHRPLLKAAASHLTKLAKAMKPLPATNQNRFEGRYCAL